MCCFSGPVHVGGTKIFARATSPERQILVYSMSVETRDDVAMILPLPTAVETGEDAVRFLDMSGYPDFFTDMKRAFPEAQPLRVPERGKGGMGGGPPKPMLAVHTVGAFEASFVPTRDDFDRLDPRFRMPTVFWRAMPAYRDYGFAVFKLRSSEEAQCIHPMAFEFARRYVGRSWRIVAYPPRLAGAECPTMCRRTSRCCWRAVPPRRRAARGARQHAPQQSRKSLAAARYSSTSDNPAERPTRSKLAWDF